MWRDVPVWNRDRATATATAADLAEDLRAAADRDCGRTRYDSKRVRAVADVVDQAIVGAIATEGADGSRDVAQKNARGCLDLPVSEAETPLCNAKTIARCVSGTRSLGGACTCCLVQHAALTEPTKLRGAQRWVQTMV